MWHKQQSSQTSPNSSEVVIVSNNTPDNNITNNTNDNFTLSEDSDTSKILLITGLSVEGVAVTILGTSITVACVGSILFINDAISANLVGITAIMPLVGGALTFVVALAAMAGLLVYAGNKWHWLDL